MNTYDREGHMRRMMGGFTQEEQQQKPAKKVPAVALLLLFVLRLAVAALAVALVDVGIDGAYDMTLWGMVRVAFGGLLTVALISSAIAETVDQRLAQQR